MTFLKIWLGLMAAVGVWYGAIFGTIWLSETLPARLTVLFFISIVCAGIAGVLSSTKDRWS